MDTSLLLMGYYLVKERSWQPSLLVLPLPRPEETGFKLIHELLNTLGQDSEAGHKAGNLLGKNW